MPKHLWKVKERFMRSTSTKGKCNLFTHKTGKSSHKRVTECWCIKIELEFGEIVSVEGGKPKKQEKNPWNKYKNQQQTQPTYVCTAPGLGFDLGHNSRRWAQLLPLCHTTLAPLWVPGVLKECTHTCWKMCNKPWWWYSKPVLPPFLISIMKLLSLLQYYTRCTLMTTPVFLTDSQAQIEGLMV